MTDDLTLIVGGQRISGWKAIRVTRGLERIPSDFDLELTERYPGELAGLSVHPQDDCRVLIGSDLVITGYIDRFIPSINADGHTIRVTGRSRCQDLVDCAAEWPGGQISGSSALGIAQKLAAPYGITVSSAVGVDVGQPIPQDNLIYGETAFDRIERVCRYRALLAYDLPDGNLLLSRVGSKTHSSGLALGQNVEEAEALFAADQRYSEYMAMLLSMATLNDAGEGGNTLGIILDRTVRRHRRRYIIAEAAYGGPDVAIQRAKWEMQRRIGRSQQARVRTDSWRDSAGLLWTPNMLAPLSLPVLKIDNVSWTIAEVTYGLDDNGTHAYLILMPPEAFSVEPIGQPALFDIPVFGPGPK